jgi:hypothetical protein
MTQPRYDPSTVALGEVVRYETDGRQARYRLQHPRETQQLVKALAKFIDSSSAFHLTVTDLRN